MGVNAAHCMILALERAGIAPESVSNVNAHGTSTPSGDPAETCAIKRSFGEHAYKIPISSTKSMTWHLLGGTGALEAVICVKAIQTGIIPPTINLNYPDPEFDLDFVPHKSRRADMNEALTNSFGFGGHNVALVLKTFQA